MVLDLTTAIAPDLAGRVLASILVSLVSLVNIAMCAGGTVALLAWSRRPTIPVAATRRTLSGASSTSSSAKAEHRQSEGELAIGRGSSRHTLVFGRSRGGLTMMQSCASAAKLRGGGPILRNGVNTMVGFG